MSFGPIGALPTAAPFPLFLAEVVYLGRPIVFTALPESFTFRAEPERFGFTAVPEGFTFRGIPE